MRQGRKGHVVAMAAAVAMALGGATVRGWTTIPTEKQHVVSLDGEWRFKLEQKSDAETTTNRTKPMASVVPQKLEPLEKLTYHEDSSWKDLKVPGNWEMAGYSPATYWTPDNCIGIYRKWVEVPKEWAGRTVKLNFDGVQNAAEIYCNGQPVKVDEPTQGKENYHQGGFTAFQADLTPVIKYGQKNLIAVRVYKNPDFVNLDTGDYFFLGGIHRTVTMFAVPQAARIEDYKVETTVQPGGTKAEVKVIATLAGGGGGKVTMQLEGQEKLEGQAGADGKVVLTQEVANPRLWSAEHPNLYMLKLDLAGADGKAAEHVEKRIGIRQVTIENGILMINHVPVKLAGICRHDCFPELGSALTDEAWRKDIEMMKANNINAIRTSHYPYGSKFYDLCDEIGMYVADEMAACWTPTDEARMYPAWEQHARETVRRDKNHPSVIIWAIGNENKEGPANKIAADEMAKLDTTRPRLASCRKADECGVEFDDMHYVKPDEIQRLADETERRKKYPLILLENPNSWDMRNGADWGSADAFAPIMTRSWDVIWKADHVPGSFLWEWADRAVADKCPTKLYDYFPATGINMVKVKGIVDGFRNARPQLYHVKMAYAPVATDGQATKSDGAVVVKLTNRYSFTDLSELKTTWRLLKDGKELKSGAAKIAVKPLSTGEVRVEVPERALAEADVLRMDFDHAEGTNVAIYQWRLAPEVDHSPKLAGLAGVKFPHLNLTTTDLKNNNIGWRLAQRHACQFTNVKAETTSGGKVTDAAALYALPLAEVKSVEADVVLVNSPEQATLAHVRAEVDGGGRFSYNVIWTGKQADIQELGWTFEVPKSMDHFSWHRQAYWSYYPETHIGRPMGTATPDSAKVDITKITRPDAFDFNSSKYNADWATLADARGNGIGVRFDPNGRHQVRGDFAKDGGYLLVVNNQASPPRDLSSNIVPDLYLKLKKGEEISGAFMVGAVKGR